LLLRDGAVEAAGPLAEALTPEVLSRTYGLPVDLKEEGGRYTARRA
jgi:iron complex transport system ATP-binding protein